MTRELPPLINAQYKANGQNAVGGLSSTGGTAVDYAVQAPGLYRVVGSYSGLFTPVDDPQQVSLTLAGGGASADAMWGPPGGPVWAAHDPSKNAAKLKGVAVYAGASGGGEGVVDRLPDKFRAEHHRGSSGASSRTAPGGSPMPPTPPGYRSPVSFARRAPTPGVCLSRKCRSPGTPRSARPSGYSPNSHGQKRYRAVRALQVDCAGHAGVVRLPVLDPVGPARTLSASHRCNQKFQNEYEISCARAILEGFATRPRRWSLPADAVLDEPGLLGRTDRGTQP